MEEGDAPPKKQGLGATSSAIAGLLLSEWPRRKESSTKAPDGEPLGEARRGLSSGRGGGERKGEL